MPKPRESILDVSSIYLFGRVVDDLEIKSQPVADPDRPTRLGHNNFLRAQVSSAETSETSLARIYSFSFEGAIFDLHRPTIFLVHGPGREIDEIPDLPGFDLISRSSASPAATGAGLQTASFARSLMVWAYDKADYTLRLDAMSGTFEQTLLAVEAGDYDPRNASIGGGRSSGGRSSGGRSSGAYGRSSGALGSRFGDME